MNEEMNESNTACDVSLGTETVYLDVPFIGFWPFNTLLCCLGAGVLLLSGGVRGGGRLKSTERRSESFGRCELFIPVNKPSNSRGGISKLRERFNKLGAGMTNLSEGFVITFPLLTFPRVCMKDNNLTIRHLVISPDFLF